MSADPDWLKLQGNFNSERFAAAAALLADDLRTASQYFEGALRDHTWSGYELGGLAPNKNGQWSRVYEYGGFASIRDQEFFEEQLKDFRSAIERKIEKRFREFISIASQEYDITRAMEEARAIVTSTVVEHCNPESILRRALPDLTGEVIDLPPGVRLLARDPVEEICSRITNSLNSSVDRIAKQTFVDGASNAGVSANVEPAGPNPSGEAEPADAAAEPTVNTSLKPSEPPQPEEHQLNPQVEQIGHDEKSIRQKSADGRLSLGETIDTLYDELKRLKKFAQGRRKTEETLRQRFPDFQLWKEMDTSDSLSATEREKFFQKTWGSYGWLEMMTFIGRIVACEASTAYKIWKEYNDHTGTKRKRRSRAVPTGSTKPSTKPRP